MANFNIHRPRPFVQNNVAGALRPTTSEYYQYWKASEASLIAKTPPIGHQWHSGPVGTIGLLSPRAADPRAVVRPKGYFGDAPNSLMPVVRALPPWMRR